MFQKCYMYMATVNTAKELGVSSQLSLHGTHFPTTALFGMRFTSVKIPVIRDESPTKIAPTLWWTIVFSASSTFKDSGWASTATPEILRTPFPLNMPPIEFCRAGRTAQDCCSTWCNFMIISDMLTIPSRCDDAESIPTKWALFYWYFISHRRGGVDLKPRVT